MHSKEQLALRIQELIDNEKIRTCGKEISEIYASRQQTRFNLTLQTCKKYVPQKESNVLDVGRSDLTHKLSRYYSHVMSLGFDLNLDDGGHRETVEIDNVEHITYDLNESKHVDTWPDYPGKFDLITLCETVEHLNTPPEFSLLMLKYFLKSNGYLVVTTPNAVSIHKRILFLMGKNPFERIRYFSQNPGDFRQYTRAEFRELAKTCDLRIVQCNTVDFQRSRHLFLRVIMRVPQFKDSIVAVFSK
ncbi:MAG: methyltransferase domain-containing protein [Candidatus Neomarinimicrobiota bacterium]